MGKVRKTDFGINYYSVVNIRNWRPTKQWDSILHSIPYLVSNKEEEYFKNSNMVKVFSINYYSAVDIKN